MGKKPVKITDPKLLEAIRRYRRECLQVEKDLKALKAYGEQEQRRINLYAKAAITRVTTALAEAGVVELDESYGVESRFLDLFGDAFIFFPDADGNTDGGETPDEPRTLN